MTLSIVMITFNEEENLPRTLKSVEGLVRDLGGEIIVVDSGSTDRTVEIAKSLGAKVFVEEWKGFAGQKNSAIEKASGDWVLSLDADEEITTDTARYMARALTVDTDIYEKLKGVYLRRKNMFLGKWIKHGGFYPDRKLRLFRREAGRFESRAVHEDVRVDGPTGKLDLLFENADINLIHHAYPTLSAYIEHMNRYSSLGAEMAGRRGFSFINIFLRPRLTFFYNYFLRLGFLDGREGFLLHYYHSIYVSWKYAKAWELSRKANSRP